MAYITHQYVNENGDFDSWDEFVPDDDPNAGQTVYAEDVNVGGNLPYNAVGLSDGSVIYQNPVDNKYYDTNGTPVDATGTPLKDPSGTVYKPNPSIGSAITSMLGSNPLAKALTTAAAIKALTGGDKVQTGGWKGTVPMDRQLVRSQVPYSDTNRRPGEGGRQYFTNPNYVPSAAAGNAQIASNAEAAGIASLYAQQHPAAQPAVTKTMETLPLARGGVAQPRYLQGATDGMADKIPSSIDGKQKAALSHGEFVIPADVVSHLGNGNSDAGANKLYDMMARIRKARTGNSEQGKRINPDKFMPGGQVGYASGGIAKFVGGGETGSVGTTGTSAASTTVPSLGSSAEGSLSPWAGDYVSDYLSKGKALAEAPYQSYTGPLTAGPSELQTKAFTDAANVNIPTSQMGAFTPGTFDTTQANKYMNPYLSAALNPVLDEQRRQAEIDRVNNAGRFTQQGAYGGGRQAIMESEGLRNLGTLQNKTLTEGYRTAYDKAMDQFNKEQGLGLQAQNATNTYGLDALNREAGLGGTQRDIEQQGITADKTQFEEQRDQPYKMVQYQKDLLQGLPISTTSTTNNQTQLSQIAGQLSGLMGLYQSLAGLGQTKPT